MLLPTMPAMHDDNQILVPPSFIALFSDARQRLQLPVADLRARYELCEDLAQHLVEQAQQLYHGPCPSEAEVLRGMHAGLAGADSGLAGPEAGWVVQRLAELLHWPCPLLATE